LPETIETDWRWFGETVTMFAFATATVPEAVTAYSMYAGVKVIEF
jgi:hypothetical protein